MANYVTNSTDFGWRKIRNVFKCTPKCRFFRQSIKISFYSALDVLWISSLLLYWLFIKSCTLKVCTKLQLSSVVNWTRRHRRLTVDLPVRKQCRSHTMSTTLCRIWINKTRYSYFPQFSTLFIKSNHYLNICFLFVVRVHEKTGEIILQRLIVSLESLFTFLASQRSKHFAVDFLPASKAKRNKMIRHEGI